MATPRKMVTVRMSEKEHARLILAAEMADQSMNEWILSCIERRIERIDDEEVRAHLTARYAELAGGS